MVGRFPQKRPRTLSLALIFFCSVATISTPIVPRSYAVSQQALPRLEKHTPGAFDQILRENALFFNMLVTFSFTLAVARPAWGMDVKDINVNLITRSVRDPRGHQFVRVRVAGVVRNNKNVELNILDANGMVVGKGFLGYQSGQLTFFDRNAKTLINGYIDSRGNFLLDDLRLPAGKGDLCNGYVDPCFQCSYLRYGWWDGVNFQVGGGRIFPFFGGTGIGRDRVRILWTFEKGQLKDNQSAAGEAEYDLAGETTGAINSVLFDTERTAESFFDNPYSLVPEPASKSLIPRFTESTGIAVTNASNQKAQVTYIARRSDGSLISGDGIQNPVTYKFAAGQQYAAFPSDIFRGLNEQDRRPILHRNEVGWMEIFSDEADVQTMYLESDVAGTALDGNVGGETGSDALIFPDLRLGPGETTGITLLNLAYDDVIVRLEVLDREGRVLTEEREFFIAGYGTRDFNLGESSNFLRVHDLAQIASLRVACNNDNSLKSFSCSKLIGVATFRDRFNSLATVFAAFSDTAGPVLVGPHFVTGQGSGGSWETVVKVAKLSGHQAYVNLDLYDSLGNFITTIQQSVVTGGQATFALNGAGLPRADRFISGYIRVRSDSGEIVGDVSLTWSDGRGSMSSTYPLFNYLSRVFQFNQVAQGLADGIEYWTGISLTNDLEKQVTVNLKVFREDGSVDRAVNVTLQPYQQMSRLLSQLLNDPTYRRLNGYIRVTAADPISAIVFYGDAGNRFLSVVPGLPR